MTNHPAALSPFAPEFGVVNLAARRRLRDHAARLLEWARTPTGPDPRRWLAEDMERFGDGLAGELLAGARRDPDLALAAIRLLQWSATAAARAALWSLAGDMTGGTVTRGEALWALHRLGERIGPPPLPSATAPPSWHGAYFL